MRRELDSNFTIVNRNMEEMRYELRHDMKNSMKKYKKLEGHQLLLGWRSKTQNPIWRRPAKTVIMKAEISSLKDQLQVERERNVKLEQYTRRENLRPLVNVQETEEENTEQLFTQILTKMGIEVQNMNFHAIHRVGPPKDLAKYRRQDKQPSPRHTIARFVFRKDRGLYQSEAERCSWNTDCWTTCNAYFLL